jgi:hypothetical protein
VALPFQEDFAVPGNSNATAAEYARAVTLCLGLGIAIPQHRSVAAPPHQVQDRSRRSRDRPLRQRLPSAISLGDDLLRSRRDPDHGGDAVGCAGYGMQ